MSVKKVESLARLCKKDPEMLEEIVELSIKGNETKSAKASWVLSKVAQKYKTPIDSHTPKLVTRLESECTGGIKRELLKALLHSKIHSSENLSLLDILLSIPLSTNDPGVKYMALKHFEKYMKVQPELSGEIIQVLQMSLERNGGLWRTQAMKLINRKMSRKPSNDHF
ncbi:MAG: hypothetical protein SGI87_02550 [Flavobacteriales bacterium]|nr:hypothetical protein [Flavobacteriales bacterium]